MARNKKNSWLKDYLGAAKSWAGARKGRKKLERKWMNAKTGIIPSMGQEEYNRASKTITDFIKKGDMVSGREYVKDQTKKIKG